MTESDGKLALAVGAAVGVLIAASASKDQIKRVVVRSLKVRALITSQSQSLQIVGRV